MNENSCDNKKQKPSFRYIFRGFCAVTLLAVALSMFLIVWIDYVSMDNHTGYLLGLGNMGLATVIYIILFFFF